MRLEGVLLFLMIPFLGFGQNFELKEPNVSVLREELRKNNFTEDVVYVYLLRNYKPTTEKLEVKKYGNPDSSICAFTQTFENGIYYSLEKCREAGGVTMTITFPKIEKRRVVRWVELIYEAEPTEIENNWNETKNHYKPIDEEAGCYYKIKEISDKIMIDIYCGC